MKTAVLILAFVALASAAPKVTKLGYRNLYKEPLISAPNKPGPRIIGGQEAEPNSIPYQAFLEVYTANEGWYCGGSLISETAVLTAAHCGDQARQANVVLGAHRPQAQEDTQVRIISNNIMIHEDYDPMTITNDIGIIHLPQPVALTPAIQPIGLPSPADAGNDFAGEMARASGWGLTNGQGTSISDVLRFVNLEVISQRDCEQVFGSLAPSILCTSGRQNTGTCSGDSGGPLALGNILIGVVSFGVQDCPGGYPSAFSRVTSFMDWIERHAQL